jgi:hypothetical protein
MKRIELRHATLAVGLAGLVLVAGCRSSEPEAVEDNAANFVETANVLEVNEVLTVEEPATNAVPAPSNPGADFTNDAQTMDDADATGMTSKLPQDEETQPAEESKQ